MSEEAYEVVVSGLLAGQFVQNVLHAKVDIATPVNPFATALLLAQEFSEPAIAGAYVACLPSDYKATSVRVRKITSPGGPTAIVLASTWDDPNGGRTGEISSAQVCPLITWIGTEHADKPGRTFLPGVSEDDIDQMSLVAPLVSAIQSFIDNWRTGGTLGGVDSWVGAIYRRATSDVDPIFAGQVSPLIGTQRRRLHPV